MSREKSSSPACNIKALSKSDSVNFDPRPRGIIIAVAGDVVFVNEDDSTTTVSSGELATGVVLPLSPKRINSTGSGAGTIYGVY
jgi:hypothetical protein